MSYAKGENTPARKRRRLPFRMVIEEREEPFLAADRAELEAECRRITNGGEFLYSMERNGDRYEHVVRFGAEHQAAALADWLRRERFAERPVPKFGPTAVEAAAFEEAALAWGFRTGAIRRVIQAFRHEPGSLTRQWSAAHQMLARYQMPEGGGTTQHACSSRGRRSITGTGSSGGASRRTIRSGRPKNCRQFTLIAAGQP